MRNTQHVRVVRKERLNIICTGRGGKGGRGGRGGRGGGRGKERRPRVGGRERLGYGKGWREEREMAVISLKGIKEEEKNSIPFELFTFHRERKS